ncbi:MAG: hypothetical protein VYA34_13085 [Myxococcota bacterium]|nr:hypothetical protein [Myxococcota bacterium]
MTSIRLKYDSLCYPISTKIQSSHTPSSATVQVSFFTANPLSIRAYENLQSYRPRVAALLHGFSPTLSPSHGPP